MQNTGIMCLPHPAEPRMDKRSLFRVGRGARQENIVVICCYMFLHGPEAFAIQLRVLNLPVDHRLPALCARGCVCARACATRTHTSQGISMNAPTKCSWQALGRQAWCRHATTTLMCWLIREMMSVARMRALNLVQTCARTTGVTGCEGP